MRVLRDDTTFWLSDSRFSLVCMERVCRFRCSARVNTLRHSSTIHANALPLPGLSSVSLVGTGLPLAFLVRLGTTTGFGRRAVLLGALGESPPESSSEDAMQCSSSAMGTDDRSARFISGVMSETSTNVKAEVSYDTGALSAIDAFDWDSVPTLQSL